MPVSTSKAREIIHLILSTNYSNRQIENIARVSVTTVGNYRRKIKRHQITLETLKSIGDFELKSKLSPPKSESKDRRQPNWNHIHKLMQAKHQTLIQCWVDYCEEEPETAYSYSQFTFYYRKYISKVDITMRQVHYAGEAVYVDYAGKLIPWTDSRTGIVRYAQIFVGVLGCSNYTFVWASRSQQKEDFIEAHNQMLKFFGGVPQVIVPDNLKSAVIRAGKNCELNRTYKEMAKHYGCTIIPARVRKPQDKSKAELGVLFATRWITVPLRRRKFFSIEEINQAISEELPKLNQRPFKRLPGCRLSRFEELDKPVLKPLPERTFEYAEWVARQKVGPDYHIYVKQHAYSVPYELVGEYVEARVTTRVVEIIFDNKRVASHIRNFAQGEHTTSPEHRPANHRAYAEQTLEKYMSWAKSIGPNTEMAVLAQFKDKPEHSMIGRRSCSHLKDLCRIHGVERFELACERAKDICSLTVKSIRSILQRKLDKTAQEVPVQAQLPLHQNVRGANYYNLGEH